MFFHPWMTIQPFHSCSLEKVCFLLQPVPYELQQRQMNEEQTNFSTCSYSRSYNEVEETNP